MDWGWGAYGPWTQLPWYAPPPPPPPPRRSSVASIALLALVAAAVGLVVAVVGTRILQGPGSSTATSTIAARVDPEVVDIDSILAGGAGEAAGTGMVMTSDGYVLTNNHVIAGSTDVTVQVDGSGTVYSGKVVGDDPVNDIAVVKMEGASGLKTADFGDSSTVTIGDRIFVIGNALGKGGVPAITSGTIADLNQTITASDPTGVSETLSGLIQIAAEIQSGDSGGPLVDSGGQIIGMDTAGQVGGATGQDTSEVGFAIPIDSALTIARQIEAGHATGTIQLGAGPLIGIDVSVSTSTSETSDGALVAGVEAGSPAASIGLVAGDVVTSLGGTTITSASDLTQAMRTHRAGQTVSIGWTDVAGTAHTATIQLASGPPA
ncbi:MAG: trypsin-like peptidase domain-containing protein [Candidatus Dormibacteria bacterium]